MIVVYDGSFENFLNVVYDVYYKKISPSNIVKELPNTLLLEEFYLCKSNESEALKVFNSIKSKFSKANFATLLNIFMCDSLEFEMDLLIFIIEGFKNQDNLQNITIPSIFKIRGFEKQLFSNVHKMTGFLRFEELDDGSLYAKIENQFNIIYFLGKHFAKRFNNQIYYIHYRFKSI